MLSRNVWAVTNLLIAPRGHERRTDSRARLPRVGVVGLISIYQESYTVANSSSSLLDRFKKRNKNYDAMSIRMIGLLFRF